ncbi:MAG TPA: tyrosine--tRNA ligase [Candidatus Stackebrandtia faecavium]|nr:tyrosine--tRNA ligase [Candidatus Stackebrandtia faecavium]
MNIFDDLQWRGLIQDSTDASSLADQLDGEPVTFYIGVDATGKSMHVGHFTQILTARRLQNAGHFPILLVGGATGLIGDPKESGERPLQSRDAVARNAEGIREQMGPFMDFDCKNPARLVNNLDWTSEMSMIDFLRDVGKHFPINKMLAREVVSARLESGVSFTEFSYQLIQANDFRQLREEYGCTLQFGGSDQWGNITAGVDYIRRSTGATAHAFVTPLVTKADGTKFGKSEGEAVWLDPELTSPYAFYQFWVNTDDRDIGKYLRFFSFRSHDEILELEKATSERPAARQAQKALAEELTTLLHGKAECEQVIAASQALFGRGTLSQLQESTLEAALSEAGTTVVDDAANTSIATLFKNSGLVKSLSEARRAVKEGGAYVNNVRVTDPDAVLADEEWLHGRLAVLRRGRKTFAGLKRS